MVAKKDKGRRDWLKDVKAEHDAFKEKKDTEEIISFSEVKAEKNNLEILAMDFSTGLSKASRKLHDFKFDSEFNGHNIKEYYRYIPTEKKERIIEYLWRTSTPQSFSFRN